jgi:hypothetical protein
MAYRDAVDKPRNIEVVRYRPMALAGVIVLSGIAGLASFLMLIMSLHSIRATSIACTRGGVHTCTIERRYGPIATHEAVPIGSISDVRVTRHKNKNSITHGVSLVTPSDAISLIRPGREDDAIALAAAVRGIVNKPEDGSDTLDLQGADPLMALFFAAFSVGLALLALTITRSARLDFDLDRRTIDYTRFRWPLRPVRRRFNADQVVRARVTAKPGSKARTIFGVALVVKDEPDLELISGGSSNEKPHEETATKINGLLTRLKDPT